MKRPIIPSYRLLADVLGPVGRKALASDLGVSVSLINHMCNEPRSDSNPNGYGDRNFLDYAYITMNLLAESGHPESVHEVAGWVSHAAGGVHVPGPDVQEPDDLDLLRGASKVMREAAEAVDAILAGHNDAKSPGRYTAAERGRALKEIYDAQVALARAELFVEGRS